MLSGVSSPDAVVHRALVLVALCLGLPVTHADWSVSDAVRGAGECILETEEISLFDGYHDTRLRLSLASGEIRVKTESNIDLSFSDVGLSVDGRDFIPADAVIDERQVSFSSNTEAIVEQFVRGHTVTLYLRFWPSYPATQRYEARFSLMGFTRAYNNYKACRGMTPS